MEALKNKIDFVALISVERANANGDPLNGNRPRTDYDGYGEISNVCIKRKIRNRMHDMEYPIFIQSDNKFTSLAKRAESALASVKDDAVAYAETACQTWIDVRSFGQVFAFGGSKNKNKKKDNDSENDNGVSIGIRGPVTIHQAVSVSPVDIVSLKITKSVNGNEPKNGRTKSEDTMGDKHYVRFGLYKIKGSINVQLAQKTGFTYEDALIIKEALRTLFEGDASSARPEGSMEVVRLYWFEHNCPTGQYSTAKVHRSVCVAPKTGVTVPKCVDDYNITLEELPGLTPEIIDGL